VHAGIQDKTVSALGKKQRTAPSAVMGCAAGDGHTYVERAVDGS